MPRYFLQLSYNGKNYHGWQVQDNAHSVQAELNAALSKLLKQETETTGCGRTDTGVHAKMFFAHFDTNTSISDAQRFVYHLNAMLSWEIAVHHIYPVADDAHARFDAVSRSYQYFVHQKKNPFLNESSYFFPYPLDLNLMNEAAQLLLQHNDFSCFSKSRTQVKTNICRVISASWKEKEQQLVFEITADRFLRNMVRAIVGTLLDVGEKRISIDDFRQVLAGGNRSDAGVSVPAHALFLTEVRYPYLHGNINML